jgi:hypothetical protein
VFFTCFVVLRLSYVIMFVWSLVSNNDFISLPILDMIFLIMQSCQNVDMIFLIMQSCQNVR